MTLILVILATCLVCEAFFSGAELALIAADQAKLRNFAESRGGTRGHLIQRFLNDPGQLISTGLVGTNLCIVLSTVVTTLWFLPRYPAHAELISLGIVTPLVLVFGEIVPKSIFYHFADRWAPTLVYVLSFFRLCFLPMVWLGTSLSVGLLRLIRLPREKQMMGRKELKLLLSLPSQTGDDQITMEERNMVRRIFEFSETRIADVMLPLSEVTALPLDASRDEVAREIRDKRHTRIPLYTDRIDQIEGILHAFDVLRADSEVPIEKLMHAPVFVPEGQPAVETFFRLQREHQGMAVVVDEYGGAVGVVTMEDILEEVVGDIEDEYDDAALSLLKREKPNLYRVQGRMSVRRFNEITRAHLPESDDYESLAGLILDHLKRIPNEGERVEIGSTVIVPVRVTDRSIDELHVKLGKK